MQFERITQSVVAAFAELGATEPHSYTWANLLRENHFVGHRFRCGGLQVVWLAESGTIKVYDAEGNLARTISVGESLKKAA